MHIAAIAQKPHPLGSAEHERVLGYIRDELERLGVQPELQAAGPAEHERILGYVLDEAAKVVNRTAGNYTSLSPQQFALNIRERFNAATRSATITKIAARLPGTASTGAVMLAAHYDSVATTPGAADDAYGVAVLLETLRALRHGPRLRNDVILLFTDAEEVVGSAGAVIFMREHPWRHAPGVVLNFDARGAGGQAVMFETSAGNEWLVRNLQAAVPEANAMSAAYEVYRRMPAGTDFTIFKSSLAGMNFAFIGRPEFYHRPQDDVAHLDRRSVQEEGRYALALTRRFGNEEPRGRNSGDAVFSPTPFTSLVVYPISWAAWLAALPLAGLLAATCAGWRRRAGGIWIAVPLAAAAAAVQFAMVAQARRQPPT